MSDIFERVNERQIADNLYQEERLPTTESFPDELYVTEPGSSMAPWNVEEDFDGLSEGARVAIYKFAGLATVKVRREALLIDSDDKVLRSKIVEEK